MGQKSITEEKVTVDIEANVNVDSLVLNTLQLLG
jgi:hypothetical protein